MEKELTKAEEQIMHILWENNGMLLRDIVAVFPNPKPHQNTIATFLKILVEKGFVKVEAIGRIHRYHANIKKDSYSNKSLKQFVKSYFNGSYKSAVSFLVDKNKLSIEELEMLLNELKSKENE